MRCTEIGIADVSVVRSRRKRRIVFGAGGLSPEFCRPDLRLSEWLGFAIFMPIVFGISFQTPLVMFFMEKIGLFTIDSYKDKRRISWFLLAIFAAVMVPSADAVSMLLLWVPMCLLYEMGIWLCMFAPREPREEWETSDSEEIVEV